MPNAVLQFIINQCGTGAYWAQPNSGGQARRIATAIDGQQKKAPKCDFFFSKLYLSIDSVIFAMDEGAQASCLMDLDRAKRRS